MKLVRESLTEWFVEDPQVDGDGRDEHKEGFHTDIETETTQNKDFRRVLYTGKSLQLVLMTLQPGEEIGVETHPDIDQFFRFDEGKGMAIINGNKYPLKDGDAIIVPAGAEHNIIADPKVALKMYTIYAPPHHQDGVVYNTKEEAENSDEEFDGNTTE
jgi:mannose-6-phosphate isomerase-like protein (cupin superfamily)